MRILVFGAGGQVGHALARLRAPGVEIAAVARAEADLTDADAVRRAVERHRPDIVVNAAAYTAVDRAEDEPEAAFAVNCDGAWHVAQACAALDRPLIHISTDYVFDGAKPAPYAESDPVRPLNVYGSSKLAGERAVAETLERHVTLRTSWVFGSHGGNFVKTMLRLGAQRPELGIVADQIGCPTGAEDIAVAAVSVARRVAAGQGSWGVHHFSGGEAVSWFGFAEAIFAGWSGLSGRPGPRLRPIGTADYPVRARRPANSRLDCSLIAERYGIDAANWRATLARTLARLHEEAAVAS